MKQKYQKPQYKIDLRNWNWRKSKISQILNLNKDTEKKQKILKTSKTQNTKTATRGKLKNINIEVDLIVWNTVALIIMKVN